MNLDDLLQHMVALYSSNSSALIRSCDWLIALPPIAMELCIERSRSWAFLLNCWPFSFLWYCILKKEIARILSCTYRQLHYRIMDARIAHSSQTICFHHIFHNCPRFSHQPFWNKDTFMNIFLCNTLNEVQVWTKIKKRTILPEETSVASCKNVGRNVKQSRVVVISKFWELKTNLS